MQIEFAKYEGAGNDFIMIDARNSDPGIGSLVIARLCDRHFGIGADGVMVLRQSDRGECSMRYYNADGSEGEMCGNGGRCFALFAEHLGIGSETFRFEAPDGLHTARILHTQGMTGEIELGMIRVERIRCGDGWWFLNTGVPHYVEFVDAVANADVAGRGKTIRHDTARFPQGTNVNFVEIEGEGRIRIRTYERGVEAETMACGTGAAAAAIVTNFVHQPHMNEYEVKVPGGLLRIGFEHRDKTQIYTNIRLSGSARRVFSGTFDTENF